MPSNREYQAKILLFGEYSLMLGSAALTLPFSRYAARLRLPNAQGDTPMTSALASNRQLGLFAQALLGMQNKGLLTADLDIQAFLEDVHDGLYLDSSIPSGYGLGSSGALVAAVYDTYAKNPVWPPSALEAKDWSDLRQLLGIMESFFHGSSSGMDPLSIYAGQPLLLEPGGGMALVSLPPGKTAKNSWSLFLLDSGMKGKTSSLVRVFKQKLLDQAYMRWMQLEYKPLNDACIRSLLQGDDASLASQWADLSRMQFTHFSEMIPEPLAAAWAHGMETAAYFLKLCGSGGGGYLLGYTTNARGLEAELGADRLLFPSLW